MGVHNRIVQIRSQATVERLGHSETSGSAGIRVYGDNVGHEMISPWLVVVLVITVHWLSRMCLRCTHTSLFVVCLFFGWGGGSVLCGWLSTFEISFLL